MVAMDGISLLSQGLENHQFMPLIISNINIGLLLKNNREIKIKSLA
jgi:hypothetical protein